MHYRQIIVSDQYGTVRKCIQYMWYITVDHEQTVVSADWILQDISGPYFLESLDPPYSTVNAVQCTVQHVLFYLDTI